MLKAKCESSLSREPQHSEASEEPSCSHSKLKRFLTLLGKCLSLPAAGLFLIPPSLPSEWHCGLGRTELGLGGDLWEGSSFRPAASKGKTKCQLENLFWHGCDVQ